MRYLLLVFIFLLNHGFLVAQIEKGNNASIAIDSSVGKVIFAVKEKHAYILMDDTAVIKNRYIFKADTGVHSYKIWAQKHYVSEGSFLVKNNVHLNRQFINLEKREDIVKRKNRDYAVAASVMLSMPVLFAMNYDYKPFNLEPYLNSIAELRADVAGGNSAAEEALELAINDYNDAKAEDDKNKRNEKIRKTIVAAVFVAEMAGLTTYIIYRLMLPKLRQSNPLLAKTLIYPNIGMNFQGLGILKRF